MTQQFEPFQKVLVRDNDHDNWRCGIFSHIKKDSPYKYVTTDSAWEKCIPYEGNEHLTGTNNSSTPPEPEFKFGDKVEVSENGIDWCKAIYFHKTDVLDLFPHVVMRDNGRRHELFKHCRKADW